MEKLVELLEASGFGKRGNEVEIEDPPDSNVVRVRFDQRGDRGDAFTREERVKLREMMEAFEKISHMCPIARRALGA